MVSVEPRFHCVYFLYIVLCATYSHFVFYRLWRADEASKLMVILRRATRLNFDGKLSRARRPSFDEKIFFAEIPRTWEKLPPFGHWKTDEGFHLTFDS